MLNTNVDFALVGHNFITFLLSLGLLDRGKKVLVLDDDRFNYGEFFTNSLTALDVQFLKAWGTRSNLAPLKKLDDYIRPESFTFFVGKKQVVLGGRPSENYRELCRKYAHLFFNQKQDLTLFDDERATQEFNSQYYEFAQKITDALFHEPKKKNLSQIFEQSLPGDLNARFNFLFDHFNDLTVALDQERAEFKALVFMTRGFFQNRLASTGSRSEIMHLFFSLISPYYKLDHEALIADLKKAHLEKGGEWRKLNLSDLKLHRGIVKSFELDSFEGAVKPQKMAFIGGYPVGLPIKLKTNSTSYNCLAVKMEFNDSVPELLKNKKVLFTSALKMGTDRPFWEVSFGENDARFNVIMVRREGSKVEFISERILTLLIEDLKYLFPEYTFSLKNSSMHYTLDVFIQDKDYEAHKKVDTGLVRKITDVLDESAPMLLSRLKNVLYFGPYNEDALGTFSSLVEIKKWGETL